MKYEQIEGKNSVLEALKGQRESYELLLSKSLKEDRSLAEIVRLARRNRVPVVNMPRDELDRLAKTENNQGIILRLEPFRYTGFHKLLDNMAQEEQKPLIMLLDGVTDPQNLGGIIRTAEVAGVYAVILPRHRAAPVTPTVAHVASGALEHMTICTVPNLTMVIEELKEAGFWVVGADAEAPQSCYEADFTGQMALVMGAEHRGISRLVKEHCDLLVRIPMYGQISSLNVGAASAVLLFEAMRQRHAI
jgi:23S rRNA (guanosine2251-2'-O)-methyltransferase